MSNTSEAVTGEGNALREPLYHYGNMTVVRPAVVAEARKYKELTLRNALTTSHPAYTQFCEIWNGLTDAEMKLVGDIQQTHGLCNGFTALEVNFS
jgi:hypothetical protein